MADVKISALPTDTAPVGSDKIPFLDVSAGATEAVTLSDLAASAPFGITVPAAWSSWTPTITQSNNPTFTNDSGYFRIGRLIVAQLKASITSTGTAGNSIAITLPVTAAKSGIIVGSGMLTDSSEGAYYQFHPYLSSTSAFQLFETATIGASPAIGNATVYTAALASGDSLSAILIYEAAS